jgi:hypothetical protein
MPDSNKEADIILALQALQKDPKIKYATRSNHLQH